MPVANIKQKLAEIFSLDQPSLPGENQSRVVAWWHGYDPPQSPEEPSKTLAGQSELLRKFLEWWNGFEIAGTPEPIETKPVLKVKHAEAPRDRGHDIGARARVSEALWGPGCITPGPADFIKEVTAWLGLTSEMSMLDLGAGLGGPARAITEAYGIWVTGFEAEAEIAKIGNELSAIAGLSKKAPVSVFDPETAELPKRKFDAIFSKEALCTVENKTRFLLQIYDSLKPNGQFFITDYLVTDKGIDSPLVVAWNAEEEKPNHFWMKQHYAAGLKEAHFEVRVTEDLTARYLGFITGGFQGLRKNIEALIGAEEDAKKQADLRRALAHESKRWAVRTEAIQAGHIAPTRFSGMVIAKTKIR